METIKQIDYLNTFCHDNKLRLVLDGEVGFGRKCVGIINPITECFISYVIYDRDYNTVAESTVAAKSSPEDAYHKGPYLAVLVHDEEQRPDRIEQLYRWVKAINEGGFKFQEYSETDSISVLLNNNKPVIQIALVDK